MYSIVLTELIKQHFPQLMQQCPRLAATCHDASLPPATHIWQAVNFNGTYKDFLSNITMGILESSTPSDASSAWNASQ